MPRDNDDLDNLAMDDEEFDEVDMAEEVDDPDAGEAGDVDGDEGDEEPEDLASAFAALQRSRQEDADGDLDDSGDGGDAGDGDPADDDDEEYEALEDDRQDSDGGPGDAYSGADYQAVSRQLSHDAGQAAVRMAVDEFRKQGIRPFSMNDLYERDERAGRVVYRNPDDPSRPFSSRMEAQQWIDSFNSQLMEETKKRAREIGRGINRAIAPTKRLLAFAPKYDAMDDEVREVFDDLIEGYEIRNDHGEVIGYSCDLDKAHARAERMASKYSSKGRVARERKPRREPSQPATDMRSHGTSRSSGNAPEEPKTLEDAFRIMREQRKAGNK